MELERSMNIINKRDAEAEIKLPPGFRFHPTDEELVEHYLCRKISSQMLPVPIIAELDLYKFDPWQLPDQALFGEREWYFFTPRDRKYPNGSRPNRAAGRGYWKATGADKTITPAGGGRTWGFKKALVFYSGRAPKGVKTNWIMHEYRLADTDTSPGKNKKNTGIRLDDWVLCRLYNKKSGDEKTMHQRDERAEMVVENEVFNQFVEMPERPIAGNNGVISSEAAPANFDGSDWLSDFIAASSSGNATTSRPPPCQDYYYYYQHYDTAMSTSEMTASLLGGVSPPF